MSRCGNLYARHWFTVRGLVGLRRPDCERCGALNPRPLTADQEADWQNALARGWAQ